MQIVVESADGARDVEVNVQVPDATVADLLVAIGCPPDERVRGIAVEGRFLQAYLALTEVGLRDGAVVRPTLGRSF